MTAAADGDFCGGRGNATYEKCVYPRLMSPLSLFLSLEIPGGEEPANERTVLT